MGLFDGLPRNGLAYYASTAHIAKLLNLPVILILDCSKLSISVGAIALGYTTLDPEVRIVGLILNKVGSAKHLSLLKEGLKKCHIPIMGVWFRQQNIELPSRHLGLIPTGEISTSQTIFPRLAQLAKDNTNWDLLFPHLDNNYKKSENYFIQSHKKYKLKIAIALDKSFNFYYQDNLDILEKLGAELVYFSPLKDKKIPDNIQVLYFGGGFPEIFAEELSNNIQIRSAIKKAINNGFPTYAECGGMMYLSQAIVDFQGKKWSMVGVLPNQAIMRKKLTLGYREAQVLINNKFMIKDSILKGHEFHHAVNSNIPQSAIINIKDYYSQVQLSTQGWQIENVYSSYLHLHFANIIPLVKKFLQGCLDKIKEN
jgi:cobyrinic acid a,c-diamide synthase